MKNWFKKLKQLRISYDMVEHPTALTTQEADYYIEGMEGVRTKSMFLTNKKKTIFYLLFMDDQKQQDMESLRKWLVPTAFAWIQATVSGKRCDCLRGSFHIWFAQ